MLMVLILIIIIITIRIAGVRTTMINTKNANNANRDNNNHNKDINCHIINENNTGDSGATTDETINFKTIIRIRLARTETMIICRRLAAMITTFLI